MVFDNNDSIINNDTINGTPGNDNLSGGTGSSTLIGQDGDDTLSGGSGSNNLTGDAGNDVLSGGTGSNILTGGTGNDTLSGGTGSNSLAGDDGDDFLSGGSGRNALTGGTGTDTFFFSKTRSTSNVIDGGEVVSDGGSTVIIDGEVVGGDGETESEASISTIADFNFSEGDKIQLDGGSFEVAPGDTSTLQFDNSTGILSLAGTQVVEVTGGVDSEVLANTEIVEGSDSVIIGDNVAADNDSVVVGGDGNVNVYRFFEPDRGFHFYTSSEQEKDTVEQQIEDGELAYTYESESFSALAKDDDGDPLTGAKPVYRLFNNITGAHLYTISEAEKNSIVDNLPNYSLEGVAYYAYDTPQDNTIALYRLYNSETGTHFFTPSASEKDDVLNSLPGYSGEGEDAIAFYVLPVDS